jgi:nitronate monooxygenase
MTLTQRLGIDIPIILAPMGGAVGPELCAAVSNAGGLGIIPLWKEDSAVTAQINAVRGLTSRPFGVNLNNNYNQDRQLGEAIDAGATILSFFWGLNAEHIKRAKTAGTLVLQIVGTAAEARRAVDAAVDIVVAQGWEAGGHVGGTVATLALVPAVADAVSPTPVVAAGGIADGRGLAAVMALGAEAAWIGTRFLLAEEATVEQSGRDRLIAATEADTVLGKDPNPTWRDSGIRWIGKGDANAYRPAGGQLAGQGVGLVERVQPAAEIVAEIWAEARAIMSGLSRYGG